MSEILCSDPMITKQEHPYEPGMDIAVSQTLEINREAALCFNCSHRETKYENCPIATLLNDIAKKTGASTLMRWCPDFKMGE